MLSGATATFAAGKAALGTFQRQKTVVIQVAFSTDGTRYPGTQRKPLLFP